MKHETEQHLRTVRTFITREFNNRQRFLKEPRRTEAMKEAAAAAAALEAIAKKLEAGKATQMTLGDLFAEQTA